MSLLWLPYICLTLILLALLLASFYRFHRRNRNIYQQRGILARHLAQNEKRACPVASGSGSGPTPSERLKDRLLMKGRRVLVFISMGKLRLVDADKATSSRDSSTVFQMRTIAPEGCEDHQLSDDQVNRDEYALSMGMTS